MPIDILFPLRWQDAADILVISFIVHRLFLLLRGTAALQIILGLLFVWLFQGIAHSAGLVLTSWFFQGIGAIAVLVIVVVFRNEIREVLIQTNPVRFFLGRPQEIRTIDIHSIVDCVFRLARTRNGALIVLQNRDQLGAYLREGFKLDGRFNPEIIESIFAKKSPTHDGAVIIRGTRITRVRTFLPLTEKEGLPPYLGTRHRAAIGLSEVSDAVILVVSEERAEVSLVHRGKVQLMRKHQELSNALGRLLRVSDADHKPRNRRRVWLTHAGGLVLTFLLVSTVWGIYSGRQLSLRSVEASINFRNIPESLELKESSAEKVEVQISGKQKLVNTLRRDQVRAFLDLRELKDGNHSLTLNRDNIELPLGLDVVRVTPPTVTVELEKRIEKEIAVKPKIIGLPPAGYQIKRISVRPQSVKVSGGESVLRPVKNLFTEAVDLGEMQPRDGEKIVEVPLALSPPSLRLATGGSRKIQVSIEFLAQKSSADNRLRTDLHYHKVLSGETLWSISRRYGVSVDRLRQLNKLGPGAVIYPGQRILLGPVPAE